MVVALAGASFCVWLLGWSTNLDPVGAVLGHPAQVEVPDLSGLARPRALADVNSASLVADVSTSSSLTAVRGAVISQDPPAGAKVDIGSTVHVTISDGIARVEMPDAVGLSLDEVVKPLDDADVDYTVVRQASETVAEGVVIKQVPDAGQRVTAADDVSFVVSSGPEPRAVLDVAGLSDEGAAYALGVAGFTVQVVERDDGSVAAGITIGTEPGATTVLPRDSIVKVVVSSGPPPVALPDLKDVSLDSAVSQLSSLGVVVNVSGGGASGGRITTQDPVAGTLVDVGSMVKLGASGG